MNHRLVRSILGLMTLLCLAACGPAQQPIAQSSTAPVASAPAASDKPSGGTPKIAATATVLTIRKEGGMCQYGGCWTEYHIKADGAYDVAQGTGTQQVGTFEDGSAAELIQLIAETDFAAVRSQPFTGTCPIAFDGQEVTYTFQTMSGAETIASCTVAIDENSPLFSHINTMLATIDQG